MVAFNYDTVMENFGNDREKIHALTDAFSATFEARVKIATNQFRQSNNSECDPKEFLSTHEYRWDTFLVAYPAAAWVMIKIQGYFRLLEKPYLPIQVDEETGDEYRIERKKDEVSAPDKYFQTEAGQDSRRLEVCKNLIYEGDIGTSTWISECQKFENAAKETNVRTGLKRDLQNAMGLVIKPWPTAVQAIVDEIHRRFEDLEQQLSDIKALKSARSREKEIKRRRGPKTLPGSTSARQSTELETGEILQETNLLVEPTLAELEGAHSTTGATFSSTSESHSRRRRSNQEYPQPVKNHIRHVKQPNPLSIRRPIHHLNKGGRFSATIAVCFAFTAISSAMASSQAIDDTGSASDSDFFSGLTSFGFSLATVRFLPSTFSSGQSSTLCSTCKVVIVFSSILSVAFYPYSIRASIWMTFVSNFLQLLSTALVIDGQHGNIKSFKVAE
ncbi:hypothetical protein DM02DRAFT_619916 [Periconia macrospinosa]|uniref:Uncharacterized protein n=1 Tax=Periconia macrospinosa TaxID=97972 RepID=A0A2V1D367_9PLEO|nr:hypothetical protein DM02DRAFT_619916 [Periconia macrospinosa]